jgi:CDP-diacylglycerol pyrophosphatase
MNGKSARRWLAETVIAVAIVLLGTAGSGRAADSDALWKIVHDKCVPDQEQNGSPAPCALVDLWEGDAKGYVVLKDLVGATQYLLIPTARVSGIESALLLAPEAPNYFADAWRERSYTERAAQHPLPRQAISLAINSAFGRSQNQLHIHIDCIRADVRAVLQRQLAVIGDSWTPLSEPLAGHQQSSKQRSFFGHPRPPEPIMPQRQSTLTTIDRVNLEKTSSITRPRPRVRTLSPVDLQRMNGKTR